MGLIILIWLAAGALTVLQYRDQMVQISGAQRFAAFLLLMIAAPALMITQTVNEILDVLLPNDGENMTPQ